MSLLPSIPNPNTIDVAAHFIRNSQARPYPCTIIGGKKDEVFDQLFQLYPAPTIRRHQANDENSNGLPS